MSAAVTTEGLSKRFGSVIAVDDVDLEVRDGDVFGFLGPNGSGKTTTLRMLLGLVYPTSGRAWVLGRAVPGGLRHVLPEVGVLVEGPGFYPHASGRRNLTLFDRAAGGPGHSRRRRISEALGRVRLEGAASMATKAYSTGMLQRLGLAAALLRPQRLLILDEPTTGLDPHGVAEVRELLAELAASGVTILLSSHLLSEVETICTRAAIVHHGRLVAQDDVARLLAPTGRVRIETPDVSAAARVIERSPRLRVLDRSVAHLTVELDGLAADQLNSGLVSEGVRVSSLEPERRSLEQVFLELTAHGADDARG